MDSLSNKLSKRKAPLLILLIFILAIGGLEWIGGRFSVFLWANQWHSPTMDAFFPYMTLYGDGLSHALLLLILLLFSYRWLLMSGFSLAIYGLISLLFKKVLLPHMPRPIAVFGEEDLHLVEHVSLHSFQSFPSGHTMTCFALSTLWVLYSPRWFWQTIAICLAYLGGYSRIYLAQHFFGDVAVGGLIGMAAVVAAYALTRRIHQHHAQILDKGLKDTLR